MTESALKGVVESTKRLAILLVECSTVLVAISCATASAAPTAQQEAYWWQDEIRTVAFQLSQSRSGAIAQWPRMTVPAGSATMPLPEATGPIVVDGKLDEPAWMQATSFPVGPIFAAWQDGPMTLQLSACRDDEQVYLAIESSRDLTELGSLATTGELFHVGRPFRIDGGGTLAGGSVGRNGVQYVIELAVPLPTKNAPLALSFPAELARRVKGDLPAEMAPLGLTKHGKPLWLEPISVNLVPQQTAARLAWNHDGGETRLSYRLSEPTGASIKTGEVQLNKPDRAGVIPFTWRMETNGREFFLDGFQYTEPILETLQAARDLAARTAESSRSPNTDLDARLQTTSLQDRPAWRQLYCEARQYRAARHLELLDAPLLFVKRQPYFAGHIYDDFYTWHPGGGIYVLDQPSIPSGQQQARAIVDPQTNETLGDGVYRDPEISWDARRVVFANKSASDAATSIYEIGLDGRGLRRLTHSDDQHDIDPCYLPDGRFIFLSTRGRELVPCNNTGVATLRTINSDGSDPRSVSVNNVNEFDPAILPDGRVLYGRWEYVDKTALYMQSLWTVLPDGSMETSLYANNLARPTALLDARPVPGTDLVVASLTPHNGQAVGAIATIDASKGKTNLKAIVNFTPEYPAEMDQGLRVGPCDPWPLSQDDVIISNNAIGEHGILELIDRQGNRELVHCEEGISCYSPMLVKPRAVPPTVPSRLNAEQPGKFLVADIYRGLDGVRPGSIKRLRVVEETARTSGVPPGGRWWNQAFLVSWQGAYSVKSVLGTVPVHPDGSAYFEVPPSRAVYFEALDENGREIQRMRTFIQAARGTTRSCIGCHESNSAAPSRTDHLPLAIAGAAAQLEPESWGSGYIDYATMIQPILERHCVRCHGGEEGIAGGIDLSGGWTWAFNISYETLLKNNLVGYLRCHNSDVTSSDILPPGSLGSGAAPLAELLLSGHQGHIADLSRAERELLFAWMDTNSNYYGTWDYTEHATCDALLSAGPALAQELQSSGCTQCHAPNHVGNDWVNLQNPEQSRILRAPLATGDGTLGLAWCRQRKATAGLPLVTQRDLPPDVFHPIDWPQRNESGAPHISFTSTDDPGYQSLLEIIRQARSAALAAPRVDMPGAELAFGSCRMYPVATLPNQLPVLQATLSDTEDVMLRWPLPAPTDGLEFELHRAKTSDFVPNEETRLGYTTSFRFTDSLPAVGVQHYALVVKAGTHSSQPLRATIDVPQSPRPDAPTGLHSEAGSGEINLQWEPVSTPGVRYRVHRAKVGDEKPEVLADALADTSYVDGGLEAGVEYVYTVSTVGRRGQVSEPTSPAIATALPVIKRPVFVAVLHDDAKARLLDDAIVEGTLHGNAKIGQGVLDLRQGGHVTYPHRREFDLRHGFSVACWLYVDEQGEMPVVLSCGRWQGSGWFLQRYASGWRWHVGGTDCDGGRPAPGRWTHLLATFDGHHATLFQDGIAVASKACHPDRTPWSGPLFVGQYGAAPGQAYQVTGRIARLEIYQRALPAEDAATMFQAEPPSSP